MTVEGRISETAGRPGGAIRTVGTERPVAIIGCGQWLRGDDQAGLRVAERLAAGQLAAGPTALAASVSIRTTCAPSAELFVDAPPEALLIVVDAARSSDDFAPGTVRRIEYGADGARLPASCRTDTHAMSVEAALALAHELGMLPRTVWIYAIAGSCWDEGAAMSAPVAAAVARAAEMIRHEVAWWIAGARAE
jgi:hydrogenase maturation protease